MTQYIPTLTVLGLGLLIIIGGAVVLLATGRAYRALLRMFRS